MGGATALIGDPSFKVKERDVLSAEDVQENAREIQEDLKRVLNSTGDDNLLFVNNYDWYKNMGVIDFLRDVGKYPSYCFNMLGICASRACWLKTA